MAVSDRSIRNVFLYAAPKLASYGLTLVTLPILTRMLTPEEYGVATLAWFAPTVIVATATLGISAAAQRYYFEYRGDPAKGDALVFTGQAWLVAAMLVSAGPVWLARGLLAALSMGDAVYGDALFVAFLAAFIGEFTVFYQLQYQAAERAGVHSTLTIVRAALQSVGGLFFVWYFDASYMGVLYGMLAGSLVSAAIGLIDTNRGRRRTFGPVVLKENLAYGAQLVPRAYTSFLTRFFDKYMLNSMMSMSVVGVYNVGQTVGNATNAVMATVWNAFQPVCMKDVFDDPVAGVRSAGRLFTVFAYLVVVPCLAIVLFAQEILRIVAPPSYAGAAGIIVLTAAAMSTQAFGMFVSVQYAYTKRAWMVFPISVVSTLVNVGANVLLIPRYGLMGAAASMVLTYLVLNGALTVTAQRLLPVPYDVVALVAVFGCVALGVAAALALGAAPLFVAVPAKLAVLGLYAVVGVRAKILRKDTLSRVLGALRPGGGGVAEGDKEL